MSVIAELAMFPLGHEKGMGKYVKKMVDVIEASGFEYSLTSMGTIFETNTFEESLSIINKAYEVLEPHANRVYCTAKFDISKTTERRMGQKVASVK